MTPGRHVSSATAPILIGSLCRLSCKCINGLRSPNCPKEQISIQVLFFFYYQKAIPLFLISQLKHFFTILVKYNWQKTSKQLFSSPALPPNVENRYSSTVQVNGMGPVNFYFYHMLKATKKMDGCHLCKWLMTFHFYMAFDAYKHSF